MNTALEHWLTLKRDCRRTLCLIDTLSVLIILVFTRCLRIPVLSLTGSAFNGILIRATALYAPQIIIMVCNLMAVVTDTAAMLLRPAHDA
jgi:hypothetical protein